MSARWRVAGRAQRGMGHARRAVLPIRQMLGLVSASGRMREPQARLSERDGRAEVDLAGEEHGRACRTPSLVGLSCRQREVASQPARCVSPPRDLMNLESCAFSPMGILSDPTYVVARPTPLIASIRPRERRSDAWSEGGTADEVARWVGGISPIGEKAPAFSPKPRGSKSRSRRDPSSPSVFLSRPLVPGLPAGIA
jgi:hypothetical protein